MILARLHLLAYRLRHYRWQDASLQRWLEIVLLLVAAAASVGWLPGRWLTAAVCIGILLLTAIGTAFSVRRYHIRFLRQNLPSPAPTPLPPDATIPMTATGWFEVEGKAQPFTELVAIFRTFATGEHVVYAHVPPSRFLWLARWPERDVGLWYAFFTPDATLEVEAGKLQSGGSSVRPALHVRFQQGKHGRDLYMAFSDEESRTRVWADLLAGDRSL